MYVVELDARAWSEPRFRRANPDHQLCKPLVYVGMTGTDPDLRALIVTGEGDRAFMGGANLFELWPDVLALLAFTAVMMSLAILRFRKRLD